MRGDAISHSDTRKCRLCFEDKQGLIYIFEVSGSLKNVARAISEVLLYEVSVDDQFPPFVCTDCSDKLHEFKEFKKRCDVFNETYKFFLKAKEGTKSICSDVKEEGIPVLLKERRACSPVVHPGKEFKVARENPVKAVKDEDEVPIGDNDFIVRAFPIRADDDSGVQDIPLAVPQSEVSSDGVACILPNNDKAVIQRGKQEAKEEEIDVPYDGLPFIMIAFPIEADQSFDEEKRQVAEPNDVLLVSEVSSDGVACVPPKEHMAVIERGKQEAEEDEIDVPNDDYPVIASIPPQESDSEDDVIAENNVIAEDDVVAEKDVIAEDLEQGNQNQPLSKEEGRKLRPRKATNYRLDYNLSDQEDGSSSSSEASYRRNSRVRKKCNIAVEGTVKSGRSEGSLTSNRVIDEQWLRKMKLQQQGMAGSVTKKCRKEELGNSEVVQRQNVVGSRSDSGGNVPVGKDAVTLLFLAQGNVSSPVATSLTEPNKAVVNSDWDWSESEQSDNNFKASEFFVHDFEENKRQESLSKTEFLCEICGKVLSSSPSLYTHQKNHRGELPFACEKCPKTFSSSAGLQKHMLAHGNHRIFKCDRCPKAFKSKIHLQQHGISHTGKRRYPCEHCEDSFRTRWQFKSHQKKHEGKVVWACDCGEKCKSWEELEKHHQEHKKNRTFKCAVCSKVFNNKALLSRHTNIHTKPFRCSICNKGFSKKRDMLDHEAAHTERERNFECKQCGMKFYKRNGMVKHFREIHIEMQKFKCRFCKFQTKYKFEWKKHENRHRGKGQGKLPESRFRGSVN